MKNNKAIYYQLPFLTMICLLFIVSCGGQSNQYVEKVEKDIVPDSMPDKVGITNKIVSDTTMPHKVEIKSPDIPDKKEADKTTKIVKNKKPKSPYLLGRNTSDNFIKNHKIGKLNVPIHLTSRFAWSSEQHSRKVYKEFRLPAYIKESYPGVIFYTKWVQHSPKSKNVSTEYDKVEYYDEKGKLLKTYDVDAQNPYLKKYPDLYNNFYHSEGTVVDENANHDSKIIHFRNSTSSVYIDEKAGFTQIKYMLYNSNESGNIINFKTTYIVIDTLGNEVNRLIDKGLYINDTYVTPNGDFLALCTGGMVNINNMGDNMNGHRDMGIRIYDLKDRSLIYENNGVYSDGVSGGWDNKRWIFFRLKNDYNEEIEGDIYFIDPVNRIEYKRLFTNTEWGIITLKAYKEWRGKSLRKEVFKAYPFKKTNF